MVVNNIKKFDKPLKLTNDQITVYNEAMQSIKNHKQAAIHLYTGGGKTYILAKILETLKEKSTKKNFNVLYISTPGAVNKTMSEYSGEYWNGFVSYITFNALQRNEKAIDSLGLSSINVIAIDEAHTAPAKETYKGIEYIKNKYPKAIVIAMSANDKRYDSRKWIFDVLTPKLKPGEDYNDRGLKWAIANGRICPFVYKRTNIDKLQKYYTLFSELEEKSLYFTHCKDYLKDAKKILDDYKANAFERLKDTFKNDIRKEETLYDGTKGDRWFVFFNKIQELKEYIDVIKELFEYAYDNEEITIKIHEFHNEVKDSKEVSEALLEPATPNTVDVILTCLKGGQSFHPENTRGIFINRNSNSEINTTQMLGRPLGNREVDSSCKLIYDIVGNDKTLDIVQSIYNGLDKPDERRILSLLDEIGNSDKIVEDLKNTYAKVVYTDVVDGSLQDLLDKFEEEGERIRFIMDASIISNIINDRKLEYTSKVHPLQILKDFDSSSKSKIKLTDRFLTLQKLFIQGYFGEYTVRDEPVKNEYFEIQRLLGDYLYMTPTSESNAKYNIRKLQEIANEVRGYNFDYKNSISHTKELKQKIHDLRILNMKGMLCESHQKFCKRNLIDIDGLYTNLVDEVIKNPEAVKYPEILKQFKKIVRQFNKIDEQLKDKDYTELADDILRVAAQEHIFAIQNIYRDFGTQASNTIRIKYKNILKLSRRLINKKEDYANANAVITAVNHINLFKNDNLSLEEYSRKIKENDEIALMKLAKRNETNSIGLYEGYVLDELGITEFKNTRNAAIKNVLDQTPFGMAYKEFTETGSQASYNILKRYNTENLPEYYQKLLKTNKYKQYKSEADQKELFNKDNKDIKDIVSEFHYISDEAIETIKEAVKNKKIDDRKLIVYAIPKTAYDKNKAIIDKAATLNWNEVSNDNKEKMDKVIKENLYCTDIISNLIECRLIPEQQLDLAKHIIALSQ